MAIQITREEYEKKFGQLPGAPQRITRQEYNNKFERGKFVVPETSKEKISRYQQEAGVAQQEAASLKKKANLGRAAWDVFTSAEQALGGTLRKTFGNQSGKYAETISDVTDTQLRLRKQIKERESKGADATNLKKQFNDNLKFLDSLTAEMGEETNLPTWQQASGQMGLVALDALTAGTYGKAAAGVKGGRLAPSVSKLPSAAQEIRRIAQQPAGLFTKIGRRRVLAGGGVGYAYDVASNISEGKEGGSIFKPGAGTVLGLAVPATIGATQSVKNVATAEGRARRLSDKRLNELNKLDTYSALKKRVENGRQQGIDVKRYLADTDVLHGAVDDTGTIITKGADGPLEQYRKVYVAGNEDVVARALEKEGRSISENTVRRKLNRAILDSGMEGDALVSAQKKINKEIAGYKLRAQQGGAIPLTTLHNAKVDKYAGINFLTDPEKAKYNRTVARALKEIVEAESKDFDVQAVNKELSKHFAVMGYLEALDGKKVAGGKLGKYFAQTIGAIVGSHFGPVGGVVGAELGGRIKGQAMSRVFKGKTGEMPQTGKAIQETLDYIDRPPEQLTGQSIKSGSRNTIQANTTMPMSSDISSTMPQETWTGQGVRELKEGISKIKKIRPGMNIEDVSKRYTKGAGGKFTGSKMIQDVKGTPGGKEVIKGIPNEMTRTSMKKMIAKFDDGKNFSMQDVGLLNRWVKDLGLKLEENTRAGKINAIETFLSKWKR